MPGHKNCVCTTLREETQEKWEDGCRPRYAMRLIGLLCGQPARESCRHSGLDVKDTKMLSATFETMALDLLSKEIIWSL